MNTRTIIAIIVNIIVIALILSKKEYWVYFSERPIPIILAVIGYIAFLYWYTGKSPSHNFPNSTTLTDDNVETS